MVSAFLPAVADTVLIGAMALAVMSALIVGHGLARAGFPIPEGTRHGRIDGLRGVLALTVIGHHFTIMQAVQQGHLWEQPASHLAEMLGKVPVGLFFMITAFLFQPMTRQRLHVAQWRVFLVRRIWRIVPLQLVSIGWVVVLLLAEGGRPVPFDLIRLIAWLAGKQTDLFGVAGSATDFNAGVLWTLFYEWIFYLLILPVCALLTPLVPRQPLILPGLIVLAGLVGQFNDRALFDWLPLFGIGMAVRTALDSPGTKALVNSVPARALTLCALLVMVLAQPDPRSVPGLLLYGWLLSACAGGQTVRGVLGWRSARVLGELSFGLYLLHGIVLHMLFELWPPAGRAPLLAIPAIAVITTLVSAALALLVERPGIRLGRRLTSTHVPA